MIPVMISGTAKSRVLVLVLVVLVVLVLVLRWRSVVRMGGTTGRE